MYQPKKKPQKKVLSSVKLALTPSKTAITKEKKKLEKNQYSLPT